MGFLSELGDIAVASNPRVSKAAFVRCALIELSCALCTGNARIYAASMDRLLQRTGKGLQRGHDVAAAGPDG